MPLQRYIVWPRGTRDGFNLAGSKLPFTLWFLTESSAISYAYHMLRDTGGQVSVIDSHGFPIVTEIVESEGYETQYGPQISFATDQVRA